MKECLWYGYTETNATIKADNFLAHKLNLHMSRTRAVQ